MSGEPDLMADFQRAFERLQAMAQTDPHIAAAMPDDAVTAAIQAPGLCYREVIAATLAGYADRPALGSRAYAVRDGARAYLPAFTTISYRTLAAQAEAIASAWRHDPRHRVSPGEFVAYIAFTGAEMTAIDFASVYAQAISVPLQANLPEADMLEILDDVAPTALVASIDHLDIALAYALRQESIRSLIVIDADDAVDAERSRIEAARLQLRAAGDRIALVRFAELVGIGGAYPWSPLPPSAEGRDALSMLMYTSGSTGTPKGALIHEEMCLQFWSGMARYQPTITIAYAPMNHFMGRNMVFAALAQGGTAYFSLKSDMSTLLEDIRLVRPTWLLFLPRLAEIIYQHALSEVQRRIAAGADPEEADRATRAEMHDHYLGDRLVHGGIGSSPTAPEVRAFVRDCFDIAFAEGYGSTESGGGATTSGNRVLRNVVIDYRLRDVPELGYYTTDTPYPRGELLIRTKLQFKGYFKRPEASATIFDGKGYVLTGDIMEERGPDHLVWVDRGNTVIKLSQAEYVAIGPLEAAYLADTPLIRQIYVYGSSYRAFLLAVVVPDMDHARARLGHEPSQEELRTMALDQLRARARAAGLKSFEVPRDVLIEREPFSLENGLLSSVRKPLRPNLKRRYADRLEAMYQEIDRQQQEELARLRAQGSGLSTLDRVAGALKANLGLASVDPHNQQSYRDLGGDSLGAVGLSMLLEEMFGLPVPVGLILDPAGSAQRLADHIAHAATGARGRSFADVHGEDATVARASALTLDAFLDAEQLAAARNALPTAAETRTIVLTGATGFLGRFLALEWMETLARSGGRLIAMVRAPDDATARARLDDVIGTLDPELSRRFRALAQDHLEVIAGDLAAPRLGLSEEAFARLAREADRIVHPGALVNHRLSYRNLFEPNVVGTAELIRLALTGRQKRFDYISTVGVPYMNPGLARADEASDVRIGAPEMALSDGYAVGYGVSKWASEVLLRDAHERFGLPVAVFRPNMILAHSRYRGQINVPDMFTRLLFSIVATGLAPKSFYAPEPDGARPRAHYDGLPVDFLAAAMRQLGEQAGDGFETYNMINVHADDGISLDSFVDWIRSAGYAVERIADHPDWLQRFEEKLRQLPDEKRRHSSLAILAPFARPHPAHIEPVRTDRFEAALGRPVPHIDEAFIHKYLGDMQMLALIPEPLLKVA